MRRFKSRKTNNSKYILIFIISFIVMIYLLKDNLVDKDTLLNKIINETTK